MNAPYFKIKMFTSSLFEDSAGSLQIIQFVELKIVQEIAYLMQGNPVAIFQACSCATLCQDISSTAISPQNPESEII